ISKKTRRVFDVSRLAVAMANARENAEHLQMALQTHPLDVAPEHAEIAVDGQPRATRALPITDRPVEHALLGPADEGILEQTGDVVADRTDHRVLEIENARVGCREHQVARHVAAMHEDLRLREVRRDDAIENVAERRPL